MIAPLAALRDARRAILIAHTVKTVFAFALLGDFWLKLVRIANTGDLLDVARHFLQEGLGQLETAAWVACAYLAAGLALTQYVLAALAQNDRPALAALRRYGHALVLATLRWSACGVTAALAWAFAHQLAMRVSPELETAARITPLAFGAGALLWLTTVHDVAAAHLAGDEAPRLGRALARGARASSASLVATHLAFLLSASLPYPAGEAASRVLVPSLGFMLSQALALVGAFVNAAWLYRAMTKTSRSIYTNR